MTRRFDAVLFDFGGVFTDSPFAVFEDLARELGAPSEQVISIVFGPYDRDTDHPWHRLERGEHSFGEARQEIVSMAREAGLEFEPVKVLARLSLGGGTRDVLVDRTREIRAQGYRTGLVTNNVREFGEHWRPVLPLDELFDVVVDSSEVGMRKPDPAIFHHALQQVGDVEAERCIFLDDYPGNVEAARRLGMAGVLVEADVRRAIVELDQLLGS